MSINKHARLGFTPNCFRSKSVDQPPPQPQQNSRYILLHSFCIRLSFWFS